MLCLKKQSKQTNTRASEMVGVEQGPHPPWALTPAQLTGVVLSEGSPCWELWPIRHLFCALMCHEHRCPGRIMRQSRQTSLRMTGRPGAPGCGVHTPRRAALRQIGFLGANTKMCVDTANVRARWAQGQRVPSTAF